MSVLVLCVWSVNVWYAYVSGVLCFVLNEWQLLCTFHNLYILIISVFLFDPLARQATQEIRINRETNLRENPRLATVVLKQNFSQRHKKTSRKKFFRRFFQFSREKKLFPFLICIKEGGKSFFSFALFFHARKKVHKGKRTAREPRVRWALRNKEKGKARRKA